MTQDKIILVTGATGKQGGAVANELLSEGFKVKAMTRNPEGDGAKSLAKLGAEIIQGDLDNSASLEQALEGIWGVFAVQNTWEAGVEKEESQGKRIAELAKKAGVHHYVYTSVGSAQRDTGIPHFDNKWRIEETIRSLSFPSYTIIRPVFFMDNFLNSMMKPGIDQGQLHFGLNGSTKLQMIAVKDIGKYGALAFKKFEELNGKEIDIAGDQLNMEETSEVIGNAAERKIQFVQTPIEEIRKFSEDYALMLEWFEKVGYNADIEGNYLKYNIKPTKLSEWASKINW